MRNPESNDSLNAAECARRTGLTVRALRIYERRGLLNPGRSGKGWRIYGPSELQRLNVIVTLKAFGMTLAQIRSLLRSSPPPLASVLEMQLSACRAKRDDAQRVLEFVQAALATITSGRPLTLEDLCHLTRSMEMGNHRAAVRELINEQISPDEERAYMTWMAARPADEINAMQAYGAAVRPLFLSLQSLRERNCEPAAPEAQSLLKEWNALAVRYGLRQRMTALIEWNPSIAQKWLRVGERSLSRSIAAGPEEGLWAYFGAVQAASPWQQALGRTVDEAEKSAESRKDPASAPAIALAKHLEKICLDYGLGDPLVYARWAGAMQFRGTADENARTRAGWSYLASSLQQSAETSAARGSAARG